MLPCNTVLPLSLVDKGTVLAVGMIATLVAGCDGPRGYVSDAAATTSAVDQSGVYRLAAGDKLKVTVFDEPNLTGEFQVNETGAVAFPLIGEVPATGASVAEFKDRLTAQLRKGYMRNPRVSVEVINYRPFNVIGEVRNAGQYQYRPGMTVQDAVAMAGGYTYRANTRTAYVRRAGAAGEMTVKLDGPRVPVMPGDDIRVPERFF
jgi:protein involved in polysaccharide export with SLBB domain